MEAKERGTKGGIGLLREELMAIECLFHWGDHYFIDWTCCQKVTFFFIGFKLLS